MSSLVSRSPSPGWDRGFIVLDADFGLANLDILLGLSPTHTLEHVLRGERLLEDILLEGPEGIRILPASSGIQELTHLDTSAELRLVQGLQRVSATADWLLIDTAAGIHDSVIKLLMAAQEIVPGDHSRAHEPGGRLCHGQGGPFTGSGEALLILVNNGQGHEEAEETIAQLQAATDRFLGRTLQVLGMIPADPFLLQAVRQQRCVCELYPRSPSTRAFQQIAKLLLNRCPLAKGGLCGFLEPP